MRTIKTRNVFLIALLVFIALVSIIYLRTSAENNYLINEHSEPGDAEGTYFRVYAAYLIGGIEELTFDFQVSCGTHHFDKDRTVHGYLPALFTKKTSSGAAVMIATPWVCDAVRFAEDRPVVADVELRRAWKRVLEGNFIPFTVWFENADNLGLGYGFAVASAFDSLSSPLRFVDARIEPSDKAAFDAWYEAGDDNLLTEVQLGPRFVTRRDDKTYWARFDPSKELLPLSCTGVAVTTHASGPSQKAVRDLYPEDRPNYWFAPEILPKRPQATGLSWLSLVPKFDKQYYGGSSQEFPIVYNFLPKSKLAEKPADLWTVDQPDYYPVTRSDGYPFAKQGLFEEADLIYSVDLRPDEKGLLACYSLFNPIGYGSENFREMYEYYFGSDYGRRLVNFGETIDLEIIDKDTSTRFNSVPRPLARPHFLIADVAVAEFVSFEFFGGGHVR